jgi:hypothetical protein
MMKGLTEGRIVHYVLPDGRHKGEHRPTIVVKVWEPISKPYPSQLQVFIDGTNDYPASSQGLMWKTSVPFDEKDKKLGTWHWIEQA